MRVEQMVLGALVLEQQMQHVGLARRLERRSRHRHAAVRRDHEAVQEQPEDDQRNAGEPPVLDRERDHEHVGRSEDEHPDQQIAPMPSVRKRHALEREPDRRERPPAESKLAEALDRPAGDEAGDDCEHDHAEKQDHGESASGSS